MANNGSGNYYNEGYANAYTGHNGPSVTNTSVGPNGTSVANGSAQTNSPKSVIQSAVGALLCIPGWLAVRSKVAAASVSGLAKAARNSSVSVAASAYTWATAPKALSIEEIIGALEMCKTHALTLHKTKNKFMG